jgi:thioredoxin-like negative regulator of GroEL
MADPIDDLVSRWKQDPSAPATIALCDALRGGARAALVQQIGDFAAQRHAGDAWVLIAVARMYVDAKKLTEAQSVLVAAGKVAPREPDIYRWLGEVLLRRGDADRAEKVLERSIQLGTKDGDARLWLERARVFKPMQTKAGARAVAAEVAHATSQSSPDLPRPPLDSMSDTTTLVRDIPAGIARLGEDNGVTARRPSAASLGLSTGAAARGGIASGAVGASGASFEPMYAKDAETMPGRMPKGDPFASEPSVDVDLNAILPEPAASALKRNQPPPTPPALPAPNPFADPPRGGAAIARPEKNRVAAEPKVAVVEFASAPPHPRDVLDALALAGVFEPPSGASAVASWDRPEPSRARKRATILVGIATVALIGGGIGAFFYVHHRRDIAHAQAEEILATVDADLDSSKPDLLAGDEKSLATAFELDSRSPHAALTWLHERALVGLLKGGGDIAFEGATTRARDVGVPDEQTAFAQIGSFLFTGDTAGAAALLSKWDPKASGDAWYELLAGEALERAGATQARDRFAAAAKIDPALVVAQVALARATAIDGDAQSAADLAKAFRTKFPDRVEGAALAALAWGRDAGRSDQAPPDADEVVKRAGELPSSLLFVPHAINALRDVDKHAYEEASKEVNAGLGVADGPGVASWLGSIAILAGDEALARKAALAAVSFSAVYPPARMLAARVALLGDRLDEAMKATEDLDPASPDVAVVRAASAYERGDAESLQLALTALPADAQKLGFLQPLSLAGAVLAGKATTATTEVVAMSDDESPWADLVSMDIALDRGDIDTADKIATAWKGTEERPLRAIRIARLSRYKNDLDTADRLSQAAMERGTVTARVLIERSMVLVARNRAGDVAPLLSKFPLVLGPLAAWLGAYATASGGKADDAKGKTSQIDPPPALAPFYARVVAAAAFAAMKDKKRGIDYVADLLASGNQDPDLVNAALAFGFKKVDHKGKPSTYAAP